jgi:predicted CXXCH cytochrome family protein
MTFRQNKNEWRHKKILNNFHGIIIFFLNVTAIIALCPQEALSSHGEGQECHVCHLLHNTEKFKLFNEEAINSGKIPCYACHAGRPDNVPPNVEREFATSQSHHPSGGDTECLVCHVIDKRHNDGNLDHWPDAALKDPDPGDSHVYTGGKINDFCLSCHDNSPVALGNPPQTPVDLSSAYEFTGHGKIDINEPCTSCHEHHASMSKPYMIRDVINSFFITGNDNSVCYACHIFPSGSYLGKTAYVSSEHGLQNKLCIDCHDPHGDSKDLCYLCHNEKYSAHYSAKRDKLCIDCHDPHQKDNLKMTKEDEEKLCFLCHKELEQKFGNIRDGISGSFTHHKVDDDEYGGGRIECSDCHNPHTVSKFNIVSGPNALGQDLTPKAFPQDSYNFQTDIYDDFCLSCHDGSKMSAANIRAELDSESNLGSGFSMDRSNNLHKLHKEKNYGCQNCHQAHASEGTAGIQRGSLLHEEIRVNSWNQTEMYYDGKASCSRTAMGLRCHQ